MVINPVLSDIAKATAKFFIAGAVIALGAPYFGAVAGLAPTVADASAELGKFGDPMILGACFALVGALDAVLKPLFKRIFVEKPADKTDEKI